MSSSCLYSYKSMNLDARPSSLGKVWTYENNWPKPKLKEKTKRKDIRTFLNDAVVSEHTWGTVSSAMRSIVGEKPRGKRPGQASASLHPLGLTSSWAALLPLATQTLQQSAPEVRKWGNIHFLFAEHHTKLFIIRFWPNVSSFIHRSSSKAKSKSKDT